MRDSGKISDKAKEQARSSRKAGDVIRAWSQERQESRTMAENSQEKARHPRKPTDFRLSPLAMRAQETREACVPRNTPQSFRFTLRSTRSDGTSGLVGSRSQETISLHDGTRKGMDRGESSNYSSSEIRNHINNMSINKENKNERYNNAIKAGEEVYKETKAKEEETKAQEEYNEYTKKYGGTKHYR